MYMSLERAERVLSRAQRMAGHELSTDVIARFFQSHGLMEQFLPSNQTDVIPSFSIMCFLLYGDNWMEQTQKLFSIDKATVMLWVNDNNSIPKDVVLKLFNLYDC